MDICELITKAQKGNAAAQKNLFHLFADKMMLVCRRYVKNGEDAEEVLLDGFAKFFNNLSSFNYINDAALYAWLKKIMINESLMLLRKKNVFIIVSEAAADEVQLEEEALNNLSAKEIFEMIVQLPVGYRTVFNLYEIEGMDHKEIAGLLGIAEGTSKSQLSKAKLLLQKQLAQKEWSMLNENLNKMHWKNKLEETGNLPAETVQNKNTAWKKLDSRLRQKSRRKRVVWFWAVAASLVVAILIPMFRMHNNKNIAAINTAKKGLSAKPSFKETEPVKLVAVIAPAQNKKNKKIKNVIGQTITNTTINTAEKDEANTTDSALVKTESNVTLPRADSALAPAIALAKTTKKLRVIHINELGEPIEEAPEMARTTAQHIFQLKLAQQEIYNASSTASNKKSIVYFLTQ